MRGGGRAGGPKQGGRDQWAEAHVDIPEGAGGADQRRRQLGHLVYYEVGFPLVEDVAEVNGAGDQFEVGEDLGEKEPPLLVADQSVPSGEAGPPLLPEVLARSGRECLEAVVAGPAVGGCAGGEGDHVTGIPRRCGRHQRFVMPEHRPTGEQQAGHRDIFAEA